MSLQQVTACRDCIRNVMKEDPDRITSTTFRGVKITFPSIENCGPREPCLWCDKTCLSNQYFYINKDSYNTLKMK